MADVATENATVLDAIKDITNAHWMREPMQPLTMLAKHVCSVHFNVTHNSGINIIMMSFRLYIYKRCFI